MRALHCRRVSPNCDVASCSRWVMSARHNKHYVMDEMVVGRDEWRKEGRGQPGRCQPAPTGCWQRSEVIVTAPLTWSRRGVTVRRRLAARCTFCAGTHQEDGGRVRWKIWVTEQTLCKLKWRSCVATRVLRPCVTCAVSVCVLSPESSSATVRFYLTPFGSFFMTLK